MPGSQTGPSSAPITRAGELEQATKIALKALDQRHHALSQEIAELETP